MDIRAIFMGLAFVIMWSSAFTSARIIVAGAPPLMSLGLRFLVSGVIAVALARLMGQTWTLSRAQWRAVVVLGLCQNALYLGLFFSAMQTVEASLASVMASSMPLLVAAISALVLRERLAPMAVLGMVVGFVGVALIMGTRISEGSDVSGIVMCAFGALALAVATLSVRGASGGGNVLMIVGLQMFVGAAALFVVSPLFEVWHIDWSGRIIGAFIYTTLIPGVLATWIWFALVNRIGSVKAATFHFLNPFFGVAIAALFLGERIHMLDVVGVAIIMAGILAVQLSKVRA
ncbi:putative DMT superfamily transporter inner membrane protein [Aquimixticola soesokkakensis]|uniref:Putative DMT superfamily transporter inner membrane protein n=1 Tax=Aquimixticola soesokkakensis TaxID=1519096 RepID=A0A1Y5R776_9RHOB|nr:DMT family transporter [Aquimixticola soesokkakensis]SLN10061.1 putative DMT superfamily transporter inner membrane protein [Aquimixticola soesokkakensis]